MNLFGKLFISMLCLGLWLSAWGETALVSRTVELEWDLVEGAKSYDIEISGALIKTKIETVNEAQWTGSLVPGVYQMRIRGKDRRGVPGVWSASEEFRVYLEQVVQIEPVADDKISTTQSDMVDQRLKWAAVPGAELYELTLQSADGRIEQKQRLKETSFLAKLPVATNYQWSVRALNQDHATDPDQVQFQKFSLIGKQLDVPDVIPPESDFVRELSWKNPDQTETYQYRLERFDPNTKTWALVDENKKYHKNSIPFKSSWLGGDYRLSVQAKADKRLGSKTSVAKFKVRSGDRSPATEQVVTLRQSIDRLSGWYGVASYLLTMVDYTGVNYDRSNSTLRYSAIGGTGRLGAGYLAKEGPWGFLGIVDLSGINVEGSGNFTYATAELNGIYRKRRGDSGELRHQLGAVYKELPETIGPKSNQIRDTNMLTTLNLHYGLEYWHALSPKLGAQANVHLYPSLVGLKVPGGQSLVPTLSMQLGVLGSYRLKKNMTGLMGYAYRTDRTDYKAQAGVGTATDSDVNSVQLKGHYLNLFLEYEL